jgi:O-antigen ligase
MIPSIIFYRQLGIKDGAMTVLATFLLAMELYLIKVDKKSSLLLFIASFPILVTARKLFYLDILFIKVNYEALYIIIFLIMDFKSITAAIKRSLRKEGKLNYNFLIALGFLIVFAVNSSFFSENLNDSLGDAFISIIIPAAFMLTAIANLKREDKKSVFYALIFGTNLSCVYGFVQILTSGLSFSQISHNRAFITFGYHNVNIFGGILLLTLPLLFEVILYEKSTKKEKLYVYISLAINTVAAMLTYTRGVWLSFLMIAFIMLISKKYRLLIIIASALGVLVARPALSFILSRGSSYNTSLLTNESSVARIQSIFASLKMMLQYPFGIGGGNFAEMYEKFFQQGYLFMPEVVRNQITATSNLLESAHNLWLQIGVEFGIICLLSFIVILVNRIKVCFKDYSYNRGIFTAIIVFIMYSTLTGIEFNHKGVITGTLIIWLIFGLNFLSHEEC